MVPTCASMPVCSRSLLVMVPSGFCCETRRLCTASGNGNLHTKGFPSSIKRYSSMGKLILCEFTLDAIEGTLKHYGIWNLCRWECHTHTSSLFTVPSHNQQVLCLMCWVQTGLNHLSIPFQCLRSNCIKSCATWLPFKGPGGHFPSRISATSTWGRPNPLQTNKQIVS